MKRTPSYSSMKILFFIYMVAAVHYSCDSLSLAQEPFRDGAKSLFVGHSFFIPVSESFHQIALMNDFPSHQYEFYFAPGQAGSPGALWSNGEARAAIEANLAHGDVELFGLTNFGNFGSAFLDYANWIEFALEFNPNTKFFIGNPWVAGGPILETPVFDQAIEDSGHQAFETVQELRAAFPNNAIYFINYGKTASIMKAMFETGQLPDIEFLVGTNEQSLFVDATLGHAGPMMQELCALSWMHFLYGAEAANLEYGEYLSDVEAIVGEVATFNQTYVQHLPADVNNDGVVNLLDVDPFIELLSNGGFQTEADINQDGVVDLLDVAPFVELLTGG